MKVMMVVIGRTLFLRFCNRVRTSCNERRPIFAQAQRMSSRVTGRQRSAHQLHSFAACSDAWRLPRSSLPHPALALTARASVHSKLHFLLTVSSLQRAAEATARTRRRHRWGAAAASHAGVTCDGETLDAAHSPMPFGFDIPLLPARARSRRDLRC